MKSRKFLIAGIVFLAIQVIAILINGFSIFKSGAYGAGYLTGFFAPGIIGVVFLVVYFVKKSKTE